MGVCAGKERSQEQVEDVSKKDAEGTEGAQAAADPDAPPPKLTFCIVGARGLRDSDWMPGSGKPDCYCVVKVAGREEEVYRTKTLDNTLEPVWKEEAGLAEYEGEALEFSVWDQDATSSDKLGKVVLESGSFAEGFNGELMLEEAGKGIKAYLKVKVKMAGQEYLPGPPAEITMKLDKDPKKKHGLELDTRDGVSAYVTAVKAGPFETINKTAKACDQLMPGDFIMKVNGVEGTAQKILDELKTAKSVEMVVRRPVEICLTIDKKGAKKLVGVEFPKKAPGAALLITKIAEGPFQDWNAAHPEMEVRSGDRIVAIGPVHGKATTLQKKMNAANKFQVTIVRPASVEPESSWSWKFW